MNALQIARATPYGHPMLLVDEADEGPEPGSVVAYKNITFNEPCFRSAEGAACLRQLAYPLALLIESFGQGAGLLLARRGFIAGENPESAVVFCDFRNIEILGEAYPGDRLCHVVRIEQCHARLAVLSGRSLVGEREIARFGRLTAMRVEMTGRRSRRRSPIELSLEVA
jgi:3-hydroxyacyl-[acyl-carrier-protein] dehydratase